MLDKTGNTLSATVPQVTGTTTPPFADILRRARAAAEKVERAICELNAWLYELHNAPDEVWDAAMNVSAVLEFASCDIQGAMEDLHEPVKRSRSVG